MEKARHYGGSQMFYFPLPCMYVVATNKANFSFHVDCFQIALFLKGCGSIMVYILGAKKMKFSLNICYIMAKTNKKCFQHFGKS